MKPNSSQIAYGFRTPLDDPESWAGRISEMDEDIVLVGHLPHLARFAALLIIGDQGKTVINFKMGGMDCLRQMQAGQWAVECMVIAAWLVDL